MRVCSIKFLACYSFTMLNSPFVDWRPTITLNFSAKIIFHLIKVTAYGKSIIVDCICCSEQFARCGSNTPHLHLPPLSVTPRTFHSKLKSHLFNLSYPDPSDHSPSPSQQHPP